MANRKSKSLKAVDDILRKPYPSYRQPLRHAWSWTRESTPESLARSHQLLLALKTKYPHVLEVRYELALCLVKQKETREAESELHQAEDEFELLDEDTYCLLGRITKDRADTALRKNHWAKAEQNYRQSIDRYRQAVGPEGGNWFPGINLATLQLVLASVLAIRAGDGSASPGNENSLRTEISLLRKRSHESAESVLASCKAGQQTLQDDNIWLCATEAEARLLLGHWKASSRLYSDALSERNAKPFHCDSMKTQAGRICDAYQRLNVAVECPFDDLGSLFVLGESVSDTSAS